MDSSLTPNLEDSELSLTPNLEHSQRISRSMRVLSYEEAKEGVSRYIEEPLQEMGGANELGFVVCGIHRGT